MTAQVSAIYILIQIDPSDGSTSKDHIHKFIFTFQMATQVCSVKINFELN